VDMGLCDRLIYADSPVKRPPKPRRANVRTVPPLWRGFQPAGVAEHGGSYLADLTARSNRYRPIPGRTE
jgi:hypothetical protein